MSDHDHHHTVLYIIVIKALQYCHHMHDHQLITSTSNDRGQDKLYILTTEHNLYPEVVCVPGSILRPYERKSVPPLHPRVCSRIECLLCSVELLLSPDHIK